MSDRSKAQLYLLGPPRLETATGTRLDVSSKKAMALLAVLATADRFERSRVWLQQVLWGSRAQKQAQSSLRRELSNLRSLLNRHGLDLLSTNQRTVVLAGDRMEIDFLEAAEHENQKQFCEGMDLANEDGFEDWLRDMRSRLEDRSESVAKSAAPLVHHQIARPLKAQLAVMPTAYGPHSPADQKLAQRVSNTLTNHLARLRWLPVVAADHIHPPSETGSASEAISEQLGVRYLARSEVLEAGDRTVINFALLEMPGRIIRWTETRTIEGDVGTKRFEAEIARVVNCLGATFDTCEQRHFRLNEEDQSHDLVTQNWRIRFHIDQFTRQSFARAGELIDMAMRRHPENSELLMLRANLALWQHWIKRSDASTSSHLAPLIRAAMRADPSDARGPLFHGILDTWHKRGGTALQHLRHACELDPSFGQAFVHLGAAHYLAGDPEGALEPLEHALFIGPLDAKRFFALGELATAYWMLERYDEALEIALRIQTTHPGYVLAHVLETASHSGAGRLDEARRARAKMLDEKPESYRSMLDWIPFQDPRWVDKLRRAVEFETHPEPRLYSVGHN